MSERGSSGAGQPRSPTAVIVLRMRRFAWLKVAWWRLTGRLPIRWEL